MLLDLEIGDVHNYLNNTSTEKISCLNSCERPLNPLLILKL